MINGFGILIMIGLFIAIISFLDWRGHRKGRATRNRPA